MICLQRGLQCAVHSIEGEKRVRGAVLITYVVPVLNYYYSDCPFSTFNQGALYVQWYELYVQ
jgi:hypothetical protein